MQTEETVTNGARSPLHRPRILSLPASAWFGRITGALALSAALVLGATAFEAILATAAVLALAEVARSRVRVKRLRQHAPRQPDADLRPFTSQIP